MLFLNLPPWDERQKCLVSPSLISPSTLLRVNARVPSVMPLPLFWLNVLFNVYSSYWILPEMSQKSAQPIFAFPQFWWTLCWCLKYESTQPFVLGILSLFSVFCWMQQLAAAEKTCDLWLGLWWSNPECICALPSRSFSYQCSTADWTGLACQAACC